MSYLKFDKTVMINLEESLAREVLRTNRKGAYHCTTVVDCNTRKYHGLLVMPVPELDDENHVLLSSFDETVIQHGAEFNLGLHKYQGNNYSPKGHKYIREYSCDTVPRTVYRVGGVIFSKEKVFSLAENRIMIKYTFCHNIKISSVFGISQCERANPCKWKCEPILYGSYQWYKNMHVSGVS